MASFDHSDLTPPSPVIIKCFKLHKFQLNKDDNLSPYDIVIPSPDWTATNSYELSLALKYQVETNRANLLTMEISCTDPELFSEPVYGVTYESGQPAVTEETLETLPPHERKLLCEQYLRTVRAHKEVISRDIDAFNQIGFTVELYAVVAFYKNLYQGHIYFWQSPVSLEYSFAMGIRNRVNSVFHRFDVNFLKNVSGYLLEGCRRFALFKSSKFLYVTHPVATMKPILEKLGFVNSHINESLYGVSIAPYNAWARFRGQENKCINCYVLADMLESITGNLHVEIFE